MNQSARLLFCAALSAAVLAGCQRNDAAPASAPTPSPTPAPAPAAPIVVPAAPAASAPVSASPATSEVIMSQPGPDGTTWNLTRVAVTGRLMTVQFQVKPEAGKSMLLTSQRMTEINLVDDATSQRYSVLKDDTGKYMASPLTSKGDDLRVDSGVDKPAVVWFKFPALPEGSTTVSINIPDVGPFDGVTVKR